MPQVIGFSFLFEINVFPLCCKSCSSSKTQSLLLLLMFDFSNLANIYDLNGEIDPKEEFVFFVYLFNEMRKWFEIVYPL